VVIVAAAIAFSAGFLARQAPPAQTTTIAITQATTARETVQVVQTYTLAQTVLREATATATRIYTTTIAAERTLTIQQTTAVPTTIARVETTTITRTATATVREAIPPGATPLPSTGRTAFVLIATGLNFNGSSRGGLGVYIPAGWGVEIAFTNSHTIPHSIAIVRNSTAYPQNRDIGADGSVIASQPAQYTAGISPGSSTVLNVSSLPEGIYWIACGVPGHALAGMWVVLVSSPSVPAPYVIPLQQVGGGEYPYGSGYGLALALTLALAAIPLVLRTSRL